MKVSSKTKEGKTILKRFFERIYDAMLYCYVSLEVYMHMRLEQFNDFLWNVDFIRRNGPYKGEGK